MSSENRNNKRMNSDNSESEKLRKINENIEKFLQENEEEEKLTSKNREDLENKIRESEQIRLRDLPDHVIDIIPKKSNDESSDQLDTEVTGATEEERLLKVNENIEHLLQKKEEQEAREQEEKEKKKEEALRKKRDHQQGMGRFSARTRVDGNASFSSYEEDNKGGFLGQTVLLSDYIFLPAGFEFPLLMTYFLIFPYAMGLIVLFLFVAKTDISIFLVFDIFTIIPVWAIGYEALAGIILLLIAKSGLSYYFKTKRKQKKAEEALRKKMKRMNKTRTKYS